MRRIGWIAALAFLLTGCQRSPYPGFKRISDDVDVRLHALGEGDRKPSPVDRVLMRVRITQWGETPGSLFSTERWYVMQDAPSLLTEVFGRMHQGDSMSVIAVSARMPWEVIAPELSIIPPDTQRVRMELSLREIVGPGDVVPEEPEQPVVDLEAVEQELLEPYRDSAGWVAWGEDLYYHIERRGTDTATIHTGDLVTIDYVGRFLDGRVFDDTQRGGQPLVFRLGDPGQVIRGLEVAVHVLRPGGRGSFIIPSKLAFGSEGSSSGIVPPHTPVAYNVIVRDVQNTGPEAPLP